MTTTSFDLTGKRCIAKFAERFTDVAMVLDVDLAVWGRKLRPPPKSDRSTGAAHEKKDGTVSALLNRVDDHPGADDIQVMTDSVGKNYRMI